MPPKGPDLDALPPEAILPLHDWLKLISSRGVDMRVAMTLAAKMSVATSYYLPSVTPNQRTRTVLIVGQI
jgi:hypothetical protein